MKKNYIIIEVNNQRHIKIYLDTKNNNLIIEWIASNGEIEQRRKAFQNEIIDLLNILQYTQDHGGEIWKNWEPVGM